MLLLIDNPTHWQDLLPLTFTRPIAALRVGILTIAEKWQNYLQQSTNQTFYHTETYLQTKFAAPAVAVSPTNVVWCVNSTVCPDAAWFALLKTAPLQTLLCVGETPIVFKTNRVLTAQEFFELPATLPTNQKLEVEQNPIAITFPYHIFRENRGEIIKDFALLTHNRQSQPITDKYTQVYGEENIFIEQGATIKAALLNAEDAPIYIGRNAKIHEGAMIKGAFALCEGSEVNMGAKIKGDTTIGSYCKVGGEVSNSVFLGYSNKGHDGFLGNSIIGEWCNLGADTNTSNLKNTYANVSIWNYRQQAMADTGLQFCGTIMADHAKCSINTMLNTGTVVGVGANLFGADFPPKFVPSFAWGGSAGIEKFRFDKFCEMTSRVMQRRNLAFSKIEQEILAEVWRREER